MKFFGRKSAGRAETRPALARAISWGGAELPRSYEAQVRAAYRDNPVAQRAVRMVAEGVTRARLPMQNEVICTLYDSRVPQMAQDLGNTRSAAALEFWRERIVGTLSGPHPDLLLRATRMEITRYGHAMPIPRVGDQRILSEIALKSNTGKRSALLNGERLELLPAPVAGRLTFAHSDWAGYSVLEEAFTRGHHAGLWAAQGS